MHATLIRVFLWAPAPARAAIFLWARNTFVVQLAKTVEPFEKLPEDCAGDVLEFLDIAMTRKEALHIATHCSSPEACAWVRAVVAAAAASAIAVSNYLFLRNEISGLTN